MLAGGITVPAYTTYVEKDYKYLIEDCEPSIVIVSNDEMYNKLKNIINKNNFIKKVVSFDELKNIEQKDKYLEFDSIIKKQLNNLIEIKNKNLKRNSPACIIYTSGTSGKS